MVESELRDLAGRLGLTGIGAVIPLRAGLSGNDLWRLHCDAGDLVLRAFPAGAPAELAEREVQAHGFARANGIATPAIHSCQRVGDRSYLIMDHVPGNQVAEALWSGSEDPDDLGRRCGATLAALHKITERPPALIIGRSWLDWPEPIDELRRLLEPYDSGRVLLHLDFHPENLIIAPDGRIVLLDWANCVVGPPSADVARTSVIFELIMAAVPELTEVARRGLDRYRDGFLAGYRDAGGDAAVPDPVRAWAYAGQRRDLADSWVPPWYLDRLAERSQELVARTGRSCE